MRKPTLGSLVILGGILSALTFAGCGGDDGGTTPDARPTIDAATVDGAPVDAMDADAMPIDAMDIDAEPPIDAMPTPSQEITIVRGTADGSGLALPIENVYVTYLKPGIGNDPAGFTVQAEQAGPAIFIAVDPATLTPVPAVGDTVSFTVESIGTYGTLRQVTAITGYSQVATGYDVNTLVQDVGASTDLVTALDSYESELVDVSGTIVGAFGGAGSMFTQAAVDTAGITGNTDLRIRVPLALQDSLDIATGCGFTLNNTPVGRFNTSVQLAAFVAGDITLTNCPAPTVVSAAAPDGTHVVVTFDRNIAAGSVTGDGSQFTFDNGLTASAASVSGRTVTVTTGLQVGGTDYTVTVANSVTDLAGTGVSAAANTATFAGFVTLAVVRINEFNANIGTTNDACDLIELRVVSGGTMAGYVLKERDTQTLVTFPAGFNVSTNDIIVVHMDSTSAICNPNTATQETTSVTEQAAASFAGNYDTAFDFWSTDGGLTNTDNVFTLYDNVNNIMDAVLTSDDATGTAAAASETQAALVADAMQWQIVGGGVPTGGFVDDNFSANAALDLNGTGTDATGSSIQRLDNTDDNDKNDWNSADGTVTVQAQTWGLINAGQTAF